MPKGLVLNFEENPLQLLEFILTQGFDGDVNLCLSDEEPKNFQKVLNLLSKRFCINFWVNDKKRTEHKKIKTVGNVKIETRVRNLTL